MKTFTIESASFSTQLGFVQESSSHRNIITYILGLIFEQDFDAVLSPKASQVEEYLQKVASLPKLAFDTNLGRSPRSPSLHGKVSTNREIVREALAMSQNLTKCVWKILEGSFAMQQGELQVLPGRIYWAWDALSFSVV